MLAGMLALSGCGIFSGDENSSPKPPDFTVADGESKIFVYAFYENPDDKPTFGEVFHVSVDGGWRGDIDDTQYVRDRLSPGAYVVSVDEMSWTGNVVNHADLKTKLLANQSNFYVAHVFKDAESGDLKLDILNPPPSEGMHQVAVRDYVCACH